MGLKCLDCGRPLTDSLVTCPACRIKNALIIACQMAYRKHVLNDHSIGWGELGDQLHTVLSENLGDEAFRAWLAAAGKEAR